MKLTCDAARPLLGEAALGEDAGIADHLAGCASCADEAAALAGVVARVRAAGPAPAHGARRHPAWLASLAVTAVAAAFAVYVGWPAAPAPVQAPATREEPALPPLEPHPFAALASASGVELEEVSRELMEDLDADPALDALGLDPPLDAYVEHLDAEALDRALDRIAAD